MILMYKTGEIDNMFRDVFLDTLSRANLTIRKGTRYDPRENSRKTYAIHTLIEFYNESIDIFDNEKLSRGIRKRHKSLKRRLILLPGFRI